MFNAPPRLHQVFSESRCLTAAWVPGRLGGGPTVMHRGLLSPLLALNSVSRPSPDPACRPFKDGTAPTSCYTQHSDGQVGKFVSLGNVKGLRTAEPNECIGYKVRLIGKWPRNTLRKAGDLTLIILFCKEEMEIASVLRRKDGWGAPHGIFLTAWFLPLWLGHIVQLLLDLKFIIDKISTDSSWALRNFLILSSLLEGSLERYKDGFPWLPGPKETRTQQERQKV